MIEPDVSPPDEVPDAGSTKSDRQPKAKKELHVVSDDSDLIEQEMAELFEEDRVTHQHGSAEPEGE